MPLWGKKKDQAAGVEKAAATASAVNRSGWWSWIIGEAFAGAWQRNVEYKREDVLCYHAVFACITLIASDISKLRPREVEEKGGIWDEIKLESKYAVIDKPNGYQNRIQFYESWILSKLIRGNTYALKVKDAQRNIVQMHILHPDRVLPLVSDDGDVFYQIAQDNLSGIVATGVTVPASEIIHDRFNCFYHPLVGLSPLYASGLPAYMGMKALENNARTFKNGGRPSGILTVPEAIKTDKAKELSAQWDAQYGGENYGKVAVIGGNVKYEPLALTSEEAEMIDLLKLTAEMVCSTFHVPAYKVIGAAPAYNNIEAQEQSYYSQCLQILIESLELALDEGFRMSDGKGFEFDLDGLLRMDTKSQMETYGIGTTKGIVAPNEARRKLNLKPVDGGDTPYLQEQNYPISSLAGRPAPTKGQSQPSTKEPVPEPRAPADDDAKDLINLFIRGFSPAQKIESAEA